ncbi:hypothetical protein niasHT_002263 [Heterodera trifolii]|uniref:RecA family profile 1 domain-containing protein n=1 Tax=Heterodera trifolii TaxID=157864 RepID=A0ABD2MDQ5_9BILA
MSQEELLLSFQDETALDWFVRLAHPSLSFRSGHAQLDALNAIIPGELVEIVGRESSGKLQLAMTLVAEFLLCESKAAQHRAVVLDFNGSFRTERLRQILVNKMPQLEENESAIIGHLDRVYYARVSLAAEFEQCLAELKQMVAVLRFVPFIIVNKVGAMLHNLFDDNNTDDGQRQLKQILTTLKEFCASHGATVVTINHLVDWRGYPTPALGNAWIKGISHRIFLHRQNNDNAETNGRTEFSALVLSEKVPSGKFRFSLTNRGFDSSH